MQKALPVATSIAIILLVAVLRERSRTLAVIVATMPINIPLAMWVAFGAGDYERVAVESFVRSVLIGLIPLVVWLGVVYLGVRNNLTLGVSIVGAYLIWAMLTGALVYLGIIAVKA
jgi:hypothetical protein